MQEGKGFTKDELKKKAILLGGSEISGSKKNEERWIELNLWMTRKNHRGLFGTSYFLTGRKPRGELQYIIETTNDFFKMLDLRRKLARQASSETNVNRLLEAL